jgi:UDP-glucuronate decarboxylase
MNLDDGRVVSNFVVQALQNHPITMFGDGRQTRSFCYVSDLVEGFCRLMASDHGVDPVNLGNPRETTMLELGTIVKELTASRSEFVFRPLPQDDPGRRNPNIARARALLNDWTPKVSLEEGLRQTVDYFRKAVREEV